MKKHLFLVALAGVALAGCVKNEVESPVTKDATMETLPLTFYCIAFIIAVFVGFFTRKLFISLETNNAK